MIPGSTSRKRQVKRKGRKPIQSVNKGITPLAIEGPCPETAPRQTPALSDKPVAYMRTLCVCVCVLRCGVMVGRIPVVYHLLQ